MASTGGQRIASAKVSLEKPATNPAAPLVRPIVTMRHFPRLQVGFHEKPAIQELAITKLENVRIEQAWEGASELALPKCDGEEMHDLAPVRSGTETRMSLAYTVNDLRIIDHP